MDKRHTHSTKGRPVTRESTSPVWKNRVESKSQHRTIYKHPATSGNRVLSGIFHDQISSSIPWGHGRSSVFRPKPPHTSMESWLGTQNKIFCFFPVSLRPLFLRGSLRNRNGQIRRYYFTVFDPSNICRLWLTSTETSDPSGYGSV